jgi:hypothetical protein
MCNTQQQKQIYYAHPSFCFFGKSCYLLCAIFDRRFYTSCICMPVCREQFYKEKTRKDDEDKKSEN